MELTANVDTMCMPQQGERCLEGEDDYDLPG